MYSKFKIILNLAVLVSLALPIMVHAQAVAQESQATKVQVRLASQIKWQALNPARGDASPQAGTIWGNQTEDGESGFLVKFVDGFSSPPHIHNITYRGIVLGGGLHNDDADAEPMWMRAGSYWTQPAGESHITSARGASVGYVEIQSGPYLVKPESEAFDNGERPINVDKTNVVWLDASDTNWIKQSAGRNGSQRTKMTFMWGERTGNEVNGTMVKLPAGFSGRLEKSNAEFKVIVITGQMNLKLESGKTMQGLGPGCYIGSEGKVTHRLTCEDECVIYVRSKGKYSVVVE